MQTQMIVDGSLMARPPRLDGKAESLEKPMGTESILKLKAVSARDFLAREIPAREMLLSPILPAQGLVMLHGPRGQGKTHIALGMAVSMASGERFLKWKATRQRKVLFIDGELPAGVLQAWLAEAVAAVGDVGDNLSLITPDDQDFGVPDLATMGGQTALLEHTQSADVVVLDNLSALVRSGKENEAESWMPIQQWALALRREGKSVLFVHHSGRNGEARGTSKREDLLDSILALRAPHTYKPAEGLRTEIHFTKHRHFFGKDADPFEVSMLTGTDGVPVWTVKDIELGGYKKAAELFSQGCDVLAVKEELGISRATTFRYRNQWKQSQQSHDDETE